MKVLVADPLSPQGVAILQEAGFTVDVKTGLPPAELEKIIGGYDALIVRSGVQVTKSLIEKGARLKVIGRAGVGVDNIDATAATARGILVMNTPHGNTLAAAEHTMALMLSMARNVAQANASLRAGQWDRKSFRGIELAGKTLGVVGLGRIGREVAKRAKAFGMQILAFDPFISREVAAEMGVELADLDGLFRRSDVITLHTPLTEKTKGLVGERELGIMKKGVRILNVARGGIVDEKALAKALASGHVAAAAIDAFAEEPPKGNPLLELPNVVATPHLGASTVEAQEKVAVQIAEQVAGYLTKGEISDAVNMPHSPDPHVAPYLPLAEAMGAFATQLADGQPEELEVRCLGEAAKLNTELITLAAVKGVLARTTERSVTLVNASLIAKERGLRVSETRSESIENYANSVTVSLRTDHEASRLTGTYLPKLGPRIVEVGGAWAGDASPAPRGAARAIVGYEVEFKPHGIFLVVPHKDTPGTISKISGLLGAHNINIAQMVVGRLAPRGDAISILRLDDDVPAAVLAEVRKNRDFARARVVKV